MIVRAYVVLVTIMALCTSARASGDATTHETRRSNGSNGLLHFTVQPELVAALHFRVKMYTPGLAALLIQQAARGKRNQFTTFLNADRKQGERLHLSVPHEAEAIAGVTAFARANGSSMVALLFSLFGRLESQIGQRTGNHAVQAIAEQLQRVLDEAKWGLTKSALQPASLSLQPIVDASQELQKLWIHGEVMNTAGRQHPGGIAGLWSGVQ